MTVMITTNGGSNSLSSWLSFATKLAPPVGLEVSIHATLVDRDSPTTSLEILAMKHA